MVNKKNLLYERLSVGDFSHFRLRRLERSLSEEDKKRVWELKASNREFLKAHPANVAVPQIMERYKQTTSPLGSFMRRFTYALRIVVPVAACFAVILLVRGTIAPDEPGIRYKGVGSTFTVYKRLSDGAERLTNLSYADEGDVIQLSYRAGEYRYGAIVSVDSRQALTLHYPLTLDGAKELSVEGEVLLPYSYELDDAPDYEMFFFIASENDFSLNDVLDSLEATKDIRKQDIPLSSALKVESFILLKGE